MDKSLQRCPRYWVNPGSLAWTSLKSQGIQILVRNCFSKLFGGKCFVFGQTVHFQPLHVQLYLFKNFCIFCLLPNISEAVLQEIILRFPEKFDIDKDELADGRLIWFLAEGDWRRLPTRWETVSEIPQDLERNREGGMEGQKEKVKKSSAKRIFISYFRHGEH